MTRVLALIPGDVGRQLLFFPTLETLQRHYSPIEIDVIVEPRAKQAYRLCRTVDQVLTFQFENRNGAADWGNLIGQIRDRRYDAAITISRDWTAGFLCWLVGIPQRVGYENLTLPAWVRFGRKQFPKVGGTVADLSGVCLTAAVPPNARPYDAQRYHDLLLGLDIDAPCPDIAIHIPTEDQQWAQAEQERLGIVGKRYIVLHGGTGAENSDDEPSQFYPVRSWESVIEGYLERQPDTPLVIVQSADNKDWVASLVSVCPQLQIVSPNHVGQLAAFINAGHLMICADRAPLHLGVAVKTRLVALFGALEPTRHLPPADYFAGLKSLTSKVADIPPIQVLEKVWDVS
ncbi:glycosyltransferase family 9 protein [Acaryochloris sp. IP29b_bin.137]|uniref:glycosyltransferase family 9 protein n=1 Tax=Acaryochloris sp. IP29b_bin.137 TaxID=2969217 RepID=UPI002624B9E2|nr:glycosyltransferase family 9 protein [Acaryochloris sp. IP29b_bin.137]